MTPYAKPVGLGQSSNRRNNGIYKELFLAQDHLLLVERLGTTEVYSRIFYKDIRYLSVQRKRRDYVFIVVFGIIALFVLWLSFSMNNLVAGLITDIIIGVIVSVNFLRSPNCVCAVGTDVQSLVIPLPSKLSYVRVFVDFLRKQGAVV